ncbi:MAG: TolC family outer membrane protein, partial [Rhodocyclaceae bacterium]|nr:TolC family outer membrane protein [Rhodocyclaceae bacterium]
GRAGLLPSITLSANSTWNETDITRQVAGASTVPINYNTNGWSLALTQPLFRWQNWVAYQQSELAVALAEAQFEAARMDLVLRSAQAYFDVLLAQHTLTTAQAQKAAIGEQLAAAKKNFEVGTATITDTHEAQARLDLTEAQEIVAVNALEVAKFTLQTLTGKSEEGLKPWRRQVTLSTPQPADMNAWVALAESDATSVRIAQASHEIAQREVGKQRAGHYPTLDLVASRGHNALGYSATTNSGLETESTAIGLQLSLPIFSGGAVSSKQREASALQSKAGADLDAAKRGAALSARQAWLGVSSGLQQVRAYEAALTSSNSALASNQLGYEVGTRINIDVLNAQSQLYDTTQKLARARFDSLMALLRLKQAVGKLGEDDIVALNAYLE